MDKEQEQLQFLSFIAIFKESIKIIFTKPKIFTQITLAFILPLSCISIAKLQLSKHLPTNITTTNDGSPNPWITFAVAQAGFTFFSSVLSLLSTAAVTYTAACIYTGKEITFKKILTVVPKVWKRLVITFLSIFCIVLVYMLVVTVVLFIVSHFVPSSMIYTNNPSKPGDIGSKMGSLTFIAIVFTMVPLIYMAMLWQLANVISVLETYYGYEAMKRSMKLIKGNMGTSVGIVLVIGLCSVPLQLLVQQVVARDIAVGEKILYGSIAVVLNSLFILYGVVVQTVFYLVCKSHHRENIDKSCLADHLDGFLGEYVPLKDEAVEIGHLNV